MMIIVMTTMSMTNQLKRVSHLFTGIHTQYMLTKCWRHLSTLLVTHQSR